MMRPITSAAALALCLSAFLPLHETASAEPARREAAARPAPTFMRVYGPTLPPFGFVGFCERHPAECRPGAFEEARFELTPLRLKELSDLNRAINRLIEPATDLEVYGVSEYWTIPTTRGDCEDYALLKRQVLMMRGWPAGALLMTVVRDEKGEGHAVLTARTAQGDFVLDNKTDEIKPWHATGYSFIMRQSYIDPKVWVSLDPRDGRSPALLAGVGEARQGIGRPPR